MKRLILAGILIILACCGARAQTYVLNETQEPSIALNGLWRFHTGDDARWAQPGFDDSNWGLIPITSIPEHYAGWVWYRAHVRVAENPGPLDLLVIAEVGKYEAYVNGVKTGPSAGIRSVIWWRLPTSTALPLTQITPDTVIAIRIHVPALPVRKTIAGVAIGNREYIGDLVWARVTSRLDPFVAQFCMCAVFLAVGTLMLFLFSAQRTHTEYLCLGIVFISLAIAMCGEWGETAAVVPYAWNRLFFDPLSWLVFAAELEFVYRFVGRKPGKLVRIYQIVLLAMPLFDNPAAWFGAIRWGTSLALEAVVPLPAVVAMPVLLGIWWRRGNREAGLLMGPMLLANIGQVLDNATNAAWLVGWKKHPGSLIPPLKIGPFPIDTTTWTQLFFVLSIGVLLYKRFTRISREQARAAAELEAARNVQSLLIETNTPPMPGFAIQSVYLPASEVGGDFFRVSPGDHGSVMVVVGDVSGKGLSAAMTVSTIIGALRGCREREPGRVLAYLNEVLVGQVSGFVTCGVVRISSDGELTAANAGHLSPYRNGEELEVGAGLPLGIVEQLEYDEVRHHLNAGDRLTFLSDGVVEARNAEGVLLGFERAQEISGKSAQAIAAEAKAFGQVDDITVLTLDFGTVLADGVALENAGSAESRALQA